MRCIVTLAVMVVVGTLWSASASAQPAPGTFQSLRDADLIKPGDAFVVRRSDGTRVTGQLQEVVPGKLRLRVRGNLLELSEAEVDRIERRDPADDGALVGALTGGGVAAAWSAIGCGVYGGGSLCLFEYGLFLGVPLVVSGGVAGYLVDRAMRHVVFVAMPARAPRLSVSPVVSRHHRGAALSVAW